MSAFYEIHDWIKTVAPLYTIKLLFCFIQFLYSKLFPFLSRRRCNIILCCCCCRVLLFFGSFCPAAPPFLGWDPMLCCCCVRCWQRWLALSQQRVFTVTVGRKHQSQPAGRASSTSTTTACVFPTRHSRNTAGFQPLCQSATVFWLQGSFNIALFPIHKCLVFLKL